jgi:putative transposase
MNRPRFGYLRVHAMLRREGWAINKKRVRQPYRLHGLQLPMKTRRRKGTSLQQRGHVVPVAGSNQHWRMDFAHDQMLDERKFRILTVVDQWSREGVPIETGFGLTGRRAGPALDQAAIAVACCERSLSTTFKGAIKWNTAILEVQDSRFRP